MLTSDTIHGWPHSSLKMTPAMVGSVTLTVLKIQFGPEDERIFGPSALEASVVDNSYEFGFERILPANGLLPSTKHASLAQVRLLTFEATQKSHQKYSLAIKAVLDCGHLLACQNQQTYYVCRKKT